MGDLIFSSSVTRLSNLMNKDPIKIIATCAAGLELLLEREAISFKGRKIFKGSGAVRFEGLLESAYRACLWSRFASRILLPLAEFSAPDTDTLYQGTGEVDWSEHFTPDMTFAVSCTSAKSKIRNSRFATLRVKDAIVDQFMERYGRRPSVDTVSPGIRIHLFLKGEQATLNLNFSGESLHRRGYRSDTGKAPLKEALAAALVSLSGWPHAFSSNDVFLDPMCGSGTILIEAALMYGDIAPALNRDHFGFLRWLGHDPVLWEDLLSEAHNRKSAGLKRPWPRIVGYDASQEAVQMAGENIQRAGINRIAHVERHDLAELQNPLSNKKREAGGTGLLVTNPPYGERQDSLTAVTFLYRCLGRKLREEFAGWQAGIFTGHSKLADALGMNWKKRCKLYNGPIACELRIFDVPPESGKHEQPVLKLTVRPSSQEAEAFANRLRKNLRALSKWARRESIRCFRIYDADLPDYNVVIDLYGRLVHISEYAPPNTVDPVRAQEHMREIIRTIQGVLNIPHKYLYIKRRHRQKGKSQYQKIRSKGQLHEVNEYNCRFLVNLSDYLDTGLFLDQRKTRKMIQEKAKGKRFLNLFSYTGTATVHAAMGGASKSVSVDLSPTYREWAKNNLALNGFSDENHSLMQADCMEWISNTGEQFDLIFIDPPAFSNSKHKRRIFDVQWNHAELIRLAMGRLALGGLLIFSTAFKRFKMDRQILSEFHGKNITRSTIPFDFRRKQGVHQCWQFHRNE